MTWTAIGIPDGGDGDVKTGINFYWTEVWNARPNRIEVFYWHLPLDTDEHMLETLTPEELMVKPEDFDLLPADVNANPPSDWVKLDPPD